MHQPEISKDAVRNADHVRGKDMQGIVAQMKQHHKCMGRTALGCTAWAALHVAALHGSALHGVALYGAVLHGTALHGAALHGLHCISLMFFCLGGGGGEAIPLSLGRACLIKPQFIITVINADCRITKS